MNHIIRWTIRGGGRSGIRRRSHAEAALEMTGEMTLRYARQSGRDSAFPAVLDHRSTPPILMKVELGCPARVRALSGLREENCDHLVIGTPKCTLSRGCSCSGFTTICEVQSRLFRGPLFRPPSPLSRACGSGSGNPHFRLTWIVEPSMVYVSPCSPSSSENALSHGTSCQCTDTFP